MALSTSMPPKPEPSLSGKRACCGGSSDDCLASAARGPLRSTSRT
jgi:hypothetical protein